MPYRLNYRQRIAERLCLQRLHSEKFRKVHLLMVILYKSFALNAPLYNLKYQLQQKNVPGTQFDLLCQPLLKQIELVL